MKALVYDGAKVMNFRDAPDPVPGDDEHLIKVEAVGICGSDMHGYLGHDERRPAPLILGHEAAGVIIGGPRDGERVTINPLVPCGTCPACLAKRDNICPKRQLISMPPREGAFAQYLAMPDTNLVTVPDDVPLQRAALTEPLAVGWHAAKMALDVLDPSMERRALIIGGGAIGLATALCLKAMGCEDTVISEPNDTRRKHLADNAWDRVAKAADGEYPIVIDAVGYAATRETSTTHVMPGGVIAHIGLGEATGGLDIRRMTLQEITFFGTYAYTAQEFRDTAQAIFDDRLGPLDWFDTRPLEDGGAAFSEILAGTVAAPKTILLPWS